MWPSPLRRRRSARTFKIEGYTTIRLMVSGRSCEAGASRGPADRIRVGPALEVLTIIGVVSCSGPWCHEEETMLDPPHVWPQIRRRIAAGPLRRARGRFRGSPARESAVSLWRTLRGRSSVISPGRLNSLVVPWRRVVPGDGRHAGLPQFLRARRPNLRWFAGGGLGCADPFPIALTLTVPSNDRRCASCPRSPEMGRPPAEGRGKPVAA